MQRAGDQGAEVFTVRVEYCERMDAAVLAVVCSDFFVEVQRCCGGRCVWGLLFGWSVMVGEDRDGGVVTEVCVSLRENVAAQSYRLRELGKIG